LKEKIRTHERQECWKKNAVEGRLSFFVKVAEVMGRKMIAEEILKDHQLPCV